MEPKLAHSCGSNLCVVSAYDDKWEEIGSFTANVNIAYCRLQGYDFRLYTAGFDKSRHPSWSKLLFVREAFKDHEWVFWIDADAIFTNYDCRIEQLIRFDADLFVCCQNIEILMFNMGVFLIRRCQWSCWLLDALWNVSDWKSCQYWEQSAFTELVSMGRIGSRMVYYPMRAFNSVPPTKGVSMHEAACWRVGDFVAHKMDAGMSPEEKLNVLKECAETLKRR